MPQHDTHTKSFMDLIMGRGPSEDELSYRPLRTTKQMVDMVQNPKKNIGKFLVRRTARNLMEKDGSLGVLGVYSYMNEHHGREWWDWEPETIWATLETAHKLMDDTPEEIRNMVMALQVVLNTFGPFEHWHIFEKVSHAFNQNHVDFGVMQPTEPDEIGLTIHLLAKIRPSTEYDDEVLQYISACCKIAGLVYLPEELFPGVQNHLDLVTFEYHLRDITKKVWEAGISGYRFEDDIQKYQVEVQIGRLNEVKEYVEKEGK